MGRCLQDLYHAEILEKKGMSAQTKLSEYIIEAAENRSSRKNA
jgi:hypothetical protein